MYITKDDIKFYAYSFSVEKIEQMNDDELRELEERLSNLCDACIDNANVETLGHLAVEYRQIFLINKDYSNSKSTMIILNILNDILNRRK